jgi:hypothetical protein
MTLSDLILPAGQTDFGRKLRIAGRAIFNGGIWAAIVATMAAWWWILWTFGHWLILAAIEALV